MSIEDTKAIGNRFIAIFNEQNPAIADEIFAPNFTARLPVPALDREGWKADPEVSFAPVSPICTSKRRTWSPRTIG